MFRQLISKMPVLKYVLPIVFFIMMLGLLYVNFLFQRNVLVHQPWLVLAIDYGLLIAIIAFLVWYLIDIGEKESFTSFPLSLGNVVLFVVLLIYSFWMDAFLRQYFPVPTNQAQLVQARQQSQFITPALLYAKMFGVVFLVVIEELISRGLVMKTYFKNSPYGLDILLSVFTFTLFHMKLPLVFSDFVIYTCIAWPMAVLYRKTQSIYYPILFHLVFNLYGIVYFLFVNHL